MWKYMLMVSTSFIQGGWDYGFNAAKKVHLWGFFMALMYLVFVSGIENVVDEFCGKC